MSREPARQLGRLALRVQGDWWVAYYALPNTMDDAVELGRIRMKFVKNEDAKSAFIDLMRQSVSMVIEEAIGLRPLWPHKPVPAPESERE